MKKEVQEKDEESSHQRKLVYKKPKIRNYTVITNNYSRPNQPIGTIHR